MNCDGREWINVVVGMVLVALGLLFLVAQLFSVNIISVTWPFFIIVPGLLFFGGMMLGGKTAGGLAIPGSIVTMVGVILLYQNSFHHFQSWAYAWALVFPTSVGIGLMIMGLWSGEPGPARHGRRMAGWGLAVFAAGALFFEFVLNISGLGSSVMGKAVGPLVLIGLGLYLIVRRTSMAQRHRRWMPNDPFAEAKAIHPVAPAIPDQTDGDTTPSAEVSPRPS